MDILDQLKEEGYELDIKNVVIDVQKTVRLLKRNRIAVDRLYLPKGILGQRRKLAEVCALYEISPVYEE